jgi:hypothetical protein
MQNSIRYCEGEAIGKCGPKRANHFYIKKGPIKKITQQRYWSSLKISRVAATYVDKMTMFNLYTNSSNAL